jgi:hypothetical protein
LQLTFVLGAQVSFFLIGCEQPSRFRVGGLLARRLDHRGKALGGPPDSGDTLFPGQFFELIRRGDGSPLGVGKPLLKGRQDASISVPLPMLTASLIARRGVRGHATKSGRPAR